MRDWGGGKTMSWVLSIYVAAVAGSVFGVFWPFIVRLFKANRPNDLYVVGGNGPARYVVWLVLGVVIGAVVAALGFASFLGTAEAQKALEAQGLVAYFAAFTYGFAAGSLFEEPLKKT
jgi:hypothetical protein